jgi:hypothetical protein
MTKPTDLSTLKYSRFDVRPGVSPLKRPLTVRGFDTETGADGNILVIACDDGFYDFGDPLGDVLGFLMRPEYLRSFNFFYNIGFDQNAVFRSVLSERQLKDLIGAGQTWAGDVKLEYISGKLLKIAHKKRLWKYYDISKFYKGGGSGRLVDVFRQVFGYD